MRKLSVPLFLFTILLISSPVSAELTTSPFGPITIDVTQDSAGEFSVAFSYSPVVDGTFSAAVELPVGLSLSPSVEPQITAADSGQAVPLTWGVSIAADGYYMIEIELSAEIPYDSLGEYARHDAIPYYLQVASGSITYEGDTPPAPFAADDSTVATTGTAGAVTITVSLTGRVAYATGLCYDGDPDDLRGVPNVRVYMDWDGDNSPREQKVFGPPYALTNMSGQFAFNFSFSSNVPANQISSRIDLWVLHGNTGAVPNAGWPIVTQYFVQHGSVNISSATTSVSASNKLIEVEIREGAALRHLYRASEFSRVGLGEGLSPVRYRYNNGDYYDSGTNTISFYNSTVSETAMHEYGHYVDDMFAGLTGDVVAEHYPWWETTYGNAWQEGWAEFFMAAAQEYWHAVELDYGLEANSSTAYQFLDTYISERLLDSVPQNVDHKKVEGFVALLMYSCWDSYQQRANGYTGDNDEVKLTGGAILSAFTEAETGLVTSGEKVGRLYNNLRAADPAQTSSVDVVYNYYFVGSNYANGVMPRSATPTELAATGATTSVALTWNNNSAPNNLVIGSESCFDYQPFNPRPNAPSGFRVYRKQTEASWNGSLTGYTPITQIAYPNLNFEDSNSNGLPVRYVVVSYNAQGESRPRVSAVIVPPAFVESPLNGVEVTEVLDIVGSVKARADIRGFSFASELDSFVIDWGTGSSPQDWHRYGVDYSVAQTSPASHATLATFNTGVVAEGPCIVRMTAHYGASTYETKREVVVTHRATVVEIGGSIYDAMNWAQVGDTIYVAAGTYTNTQAHPTINLKQSVLVIPEGGIVEIRPYGNSPIMAATNLDYPPKLSGLTFKRVSASSSATSYGISLSTSAITLKECFFDNLEASVGAAIMATGGCNVVLEDCDFLNTQRYQSSLGSIIEMQATAGGKPTGAFVRCTFEGNEVPAFNISYLLSNPLQNTDPKPYFDECRFQGNLGGDYVVKLSNTLRTLNVFSCVFVDNVLTLNAGTPGAVLYCDNAKVWLDNCTIADNVGSGTDAGAVGIGSNGTSPVTIDDSIIAFNDGPVVNKTNSGMPTNVIATRCVFYNNGAGSYRTDAQWASAGTSVFAENPAFCGAANPEQYYGLYAFSPAAPGHNDEDGLHFDERVGAHDVHCVPTATVTVATGDDTNNIPGAPLLVCPQGEVAGDHMDHVVVTVVFDDDEVTRTLAASELSLQPPYLTTGIASSAKLHGTNSTGYTITLDHPYAAGYGVSDPVTLYLDGYPLTQTATFVHRSFDMKSAGSPGPTPCGGDLSCPDGKVTNADFAWFVTHYPSGGNQPPYFEAADYEPAAGGTWGTITLADFGAFSAHFVNGGHKYPSTDPLLQTVGDVEEIASTHVTLGFTEEYPTALEHKLYVDVRLEDCADKKWCVFAIRANRADLSLRTWLPTTWASSSAPFVTLGTGSDQQLVFGVIMINDSEESTRQLGRLVFDVAGTDPVAISNEEFILTFGELEIMPEGQQGQSLLASAEPVFAHMSGVSGRVLNQTIQQVFHNRLEQNFPNPFNPQTIVAYSLKDASNVSLAIYDVAGRRVRELVNENRTPGTYKVVWDGRDGNGTQVASGVYFYKLVAGSFVATKKMVMLK